jgi:hypothetical protein
MRWHFYRTAGESRFDRWMWSHEDDEHKVVAASSRSFAEYHECMQDALANGYRSKLERQRPRALQLPDSDRV